MMSLTLRLDAPGSWYAPMAYALRTGITLGAIRLPMIHERHSQQEQQQQEQEQQDQEGAAQGR